MPRHPPQQEPRHAPHRQGRDGPLVSGPGRERLHRADVARRGQGEIRERYLLPERVMCGASTYGSGRWPEAAPMESASTPV